MKRLKNYRKTICGINYGKFTILKNQIKDKYVYYINSRNPKMTGKELIKIYSSKKKVKILNKFTLPIISFLVNLFSIPYLIITFFLNRYFNGLFKFISNCFKNKDIRVFVWFGLIILLILYI